ncbi:MAG: sigma-70 family RNA polymerase sigma factor [Polyangiales bacterium]
MDSSLLGHDDRSLAADFSLGDRRALDRVFAAVLPRMRAVAARVLHRAAPELIDDAVQTACLRAMAARARFDASRASSLMTWLSRITFRVALDLKDAALAHPTDDLDDLDPPSDPWAQAECADAVRACFERLPIDEREALRLRHVEGLTWEKAAAVAGCTVDVMRGRVSRAERLARELVEETTESYVAIPRTGAVDRERVRGPRLVLADRRTTMKTSKKTTVMSSATTHSRQAQQPDVTACVEDEREDATPEAEARKTSANEAAWYQMQAEIDAVPHEQAETPRADVDYVGRLAMERARAWSQPVIVARLSRLPSEEFDIADLERIEPLAMAMKYARMKQGDCDAVQSGAQADPEVMRAAYDTRRRMVKSARLFFGAKPGVEDRLRLIAAGQNIDEIAAGLLRLAELYREYAASRPREPFGDYFPDDDEKAQSLSETLQLSARPADEAAVWSRRVAQSWALLEASYEPVRATVAWLLRDDPSVAEKTPTLTQMRRPSTKPEVDKGGEVKPAEAKPAATETKPEAKKPEAKPAEAKPTEVKASDAKVNVKPADVKPADAKPTDDE